MILSTCHPLDRPAPFTYSRALLADWRPWVVPHQIVLVMESCTGKVVVSCNCLRQRGSGPAHYQPLGVRSRWEPGEAARLWREHMAEVRG